MTYKDFEVIAYPGLDGDPDKFYCEVYDRSDMEHTTVLDMFSVTLERDPNGEVTSSLTDSMQNYIDARIDKLTVLRLTFENDRLSDLLRYSLVHASAFQNEKKLYASLKDDIGMTDDEIRSYAPSYLAPYIDNSMYPQRIADFIANTVTERLDTESAYVSFKDINERFGTTLPYDKNLLGEVCRTLEREHSDLISSALAFDDSGGIRVNINSGDEQVEDETEAFSFAFSM